MSKLNIENAWLSWEEVLKKSESKRIIYFGRGEWFEKSMPYVGDRSDYVVDNNRYEQGQEEAGLKILSPNVLKEENLDDILVIITTTSFQEVAEQLIGFGLVAGQHFIVTPSLKNYRTLSRLNEHDATVYLTCSDQPIQEHDHKGGGLYSYNLQEGKLLKILSGLCHGIIATDEHIYLVDDTVGIRVMDKKFKQVAQFDLPEKSRPHGIAYCPKRKLIFVNLSGMDAIGIYSAEKYESVDTIYLSEKWKRSRIAQHHVNDLCVYEDSLFVSMFSLSGNWKRNVYDGGILEVDIDSRKPWMPAVTNLWMPHSPIIIRGNLCYCDSNRGTIHDMSWKRITKFNGFVRGMDFDGQFYFVGQSMHRYVDRLAGATENISLDTGFYIVDERHKTTKFFSLPELVDINTVSLLR